MTEPPVLVLGNGGWGTAIGILLAQKGLEVRIWGHDASYAEQVERTRENPKFLPGLKLPDSVRVASSARALSQGVSTIFCVVPTQFIRTTLSAIRAELPDSPTVVSCSKGFERATFELPSRVISAVLKGSRVGVLSGPSHAEEVARNLPAAVVAASIPRDIGLEVQRLLGGPRFRVYTSMDPVGVEVAGATKNVIALAAGIADGLGFGDNTRAGLLTRGLREMTRLGEALGARAETFAGLAGMGDLIATCTSGLSRNHTVGVRIARGETLDEILRSTSTVAEGVETARSLTSLSRTLGVYLPITMEVNAVLFQKKSPREAVEALLSRESGDEAS